VTTSNSDNIERLTRLINAVYIAKPVSFDQLISRVEDVGSATVLMTEHGAKTVAWQQSM
jgi:hypothetical protein